MYLVINEDGSPSMANELSEEIMECVEAGIVDIYDISCSPVKVLVSPTIWVEVEEYKSCLELPTVDN
jgi:hypothetical protein